MLATLRLYQFRNILEQTFRFSPSLNVFFGQNGQGKTNLLESIHLLLTGDSFRTVTAAHYVTHERLAGSLTGTFVTAGIIEKHQLKFQDGKKVFFVDDKKSKLESRRNVVQFNPESLSAIKGSPEQRRILIDEVLAQSSHGGRQTLANFRKILRSRNLTLKHIAREGSTPSIEQTLEALTEQFLLLSTQVTHLRLNLIAQIKESLQSSAQNILENPKRVELRYVVSNRQIEDFSENEIFQILQARLSQLGTAERASGTSLVGPHKHDLAFFFDGHDSRFFCSQGQQRGLILALKFSQIMYYKKLHGELPLLLLDDVLSELDFVRRSALLRHLENLETQIFMTTTDLNWMTQMKTTAEHIFEIEDGRKISERFL